MLGTFKLDYNDIPTYTIGSVKYEDYTGDHANEPVIRKLNEKILPPTKKKTLRMMANIRCYKLMHVIVYNITNTNNCRFLKERIVPHVVGTIAC